MRMKVFLLVFLFGNSIYLFGQDKFGSGYYISQNRDTVKGFIEYRNNFGYSFKFRSIPRERSKELSTENVIQFGFTNGSIYRMIDFALGDAATTPVFAQVLFDGQIDLLVYKSKLFLDGGGTNRFKLSGRRPISRGEAIKILQENTGYLNILLRDCPEVKDQAGKVRISSAAIADILSKYHDCTKATYANYSKGRKKQINLGFSIGVALPNIKFEATSNNSYSAYLARSTFQDSPISPLIGVHYVSRGRRPSALFSFLQDLQFSKAEFVGSSFYNWEADGSEFTETSKTIIKYSKVDYRFGLRISARSNTFNPYASFGLSISRHFGLTSKSDITLQINDAVEERKEAPIDNRSGGSWVSLGVSKKVKEDHKMFLEITRDTSGSINTTNFKVGYLF